MSDIIDDPLLPISSTWEEAVTEAEALGYEVLLVEYVECADTPGLLGQANGSIHYGNRRIRIKSTLDEHRRIQTLEHELEHARNPDQGAPIDKAWYDRKIEALADELEGYDVQG